MAKHHYLVTVKKIPERADEDALQFEVENHDDIFGVVKRIASRPDFTEEEAKAFGVGLKLFSEVMLKNRDKPLFTDFMPHFMNFMKELKKG